MHDDKKHWYFFAGGGTGGHIYPAIAIAQQIEQIDPEANIMFLISKREVDSAILDQTGYERAKLDAIGLSRKNALRFLPCLFKSTKVAKMIIAPAKGRAVVISAGGFVSAPAVLAARKLGVPVAMTNVDAVPGKANKLLSRFASEIFVQFEDTLKLFENVKSNVSATGCPLRADFAASDPQQANEQLGLDPAKKLLLICGGSSGAMSVNKAFEAVLGDLEQFADSWQAVHITGANYDAPAWALDQGSFVCKRLSYCHDMPSLLARADLIVGRAGAVSIAEYAASATPAICLPYPYHKDQHQRKNVQSLVDAGAAVIVDDAPNSREVTVKALRAHLGRIMADNELLGKMTRSAVSKATPNAAKNIAEKLLCMAHSSV